MLRMVRGATFNIIFGPGGLVLGGTIFNVTGLAEVPGFSRI